MILEDFSKGLLNKDIPTYLTKVILYSLSTNQYSFNIDELCSSMYITKQKLNNEIKKTKNIEGFLTVLLLDNKIDITVLNVTISLNEKEKEKKSGKQNLKLKSKNKGVNPFVIDIFSFWCEVMGKTGRTVLDTKRIGIIEKALSLYDFDFCKAVILGCSKSLWHMGYNDKTDSTFYTKKEYNSLELIFRNSDNVDKFSLLSDYMPITQQLLKMKTNNNSVSARMNDDEWASQRSSSFDGLFDKINKNIDNKKQIKQNKEPLKISLSSNVNSLLMLQKESMNFLLTGNVVSSTTNTSLFLDAEIVDAEIVDAEIVDAEIVDAEIVDAEIVDDIPEYLKYLK